MIVDLLIVAHCRKFPAEFERNRSDAKTLHVEALMSAR